MSSITNSSAKNKTSDELKFEVESALSAVSQDLSQLKREVTPKKVVEEVIIKDRFQGVRSQIHTVQNGWNYLVQKPELLIGLGVATGVLLAVISAPKRRYQNYFPYAY